MQESVLIVGAGSGLSESIARLCRSKRMKVVLAARNINKLKKLKKKLVQIQLNVTPPISKVCQIFLRKLIK